MRTANEKIKYKLTFKGVEVFQSEINDKDFAKFRFVSRYFGQIFIFVPLTEEERTKIFLKRILTVIGCRNFTFPDTKKITKRFGGRTYYATIVYDEFKDVHVARIKTLYKNKE